MKIYLINPDCVEVKFCGTVETPDSIVQYLLSSYIRTLNTVDRIIEFDSYCNEIFKC